MSPREPALLSCTLHSEIKNRTFKVGTYLAKLKKSFKKLTLEQLDAERCLAAELEFGVRRTRGMILPSQLRNRYSVLNFKVIKTLLLSINANTKDIELEDMLLLKKETQKLFALKRAEKNFKRSNKRKPLTFLSPSEVVAGLKKNKKAHIIYDSGQYVFTPKESYGGYISALISEDAIQLLLRSRVIEQGVYFNADGRRSYNLRETGKKASLRLPAWIMKLDKSYLTACGVR